MSLNVVALMGRPTTDIELKFTQSGNAVCNFSLAVDRDFTPKGAEKQTDFITIVCWKGTAEFCEKYVHKGQLIAVQGRIQTRKYTDRDENKRTAFEVVADHVHFAEPKRDTGNKNTYGTAPYKPDIEADASDFSEITSDDLPF